MEITTCANHAGTNLVRDFESALESVSDLVSWGRRTGFSSYVGEIIAQSPRYHQEFPCCPSAHYADHLVSAAIRTYLAGEAT